MTPYVCPRCGHRLIGLALTTARGKGTCPACGEALPDELRWESDPVESELEPPPDPSEQLQDAAPFSEPAATPLDAVEPLDLSKIRRNQYAELPAILALMLPVIVCGVALACQAEAVGAWIAISAGTVVATALLLAFDAAQLGTTDLKGVQRRTPAGLFGWMLFCWVIAYPLVYYRRSHFGRSNLCLFAVPIALFVAVAPFLREYVPRLVGPGRLPQCDSREVVGMVDSILRKDIDDITVQSVKGHREVGLDRDGQGRTGQCEVTIDGDKVTITYHVRWLNRRAGSYEVKVDQFTPPSPPNCTCKAVRDLLEQMLRQGPNGHLVQSVTQHAETSYDRERKIRHGTCWVTFQGQGQRIGYRVYWVDQATGRYEVVIE
jgi:hypothetical protein